jgi:hypothetical protein
MRHRTGYPDRPTAALRLSARLASAALLAVALALPQGRVLAAASLQTATLEPHEITIGQSAELTIKTVGADLGGLTLPSVGGLQFRIVAQSRHAEDIHGATVIVTTTTIRVTPLVSGDFEVPGLVPNAPSLQLHVDVDDSVGKLPHPAPGLVGAPPPRSAALDGVRLTPDGSAFVRLVLPKREVFVGESVPVDIEVGLRPGFVTSLNGLPTLTSSDFTLGNLSRQPERSERAVGGNAFSVLTWHSVLSPVKPGSYPLGVTAPITVRIRLRPEQEAKLDDLLGDPFLQNVYGKTVKKELKIESPDATLTVLALPAEGRPADFRGAVGTFSVSSELSSATAALGDPLTLRLHIRGAGNFDRVDTPMLTNLADWKTYPPTATFKPGDAIGQAGEKTFEQPLVARATGSHPLPPLKFSYFDPAAGRYVTATAAPLSVTIAPAAGDAAPLASEASSQAGVQAAALTAVQAAVPPGELRADHRVEGARVRSLVPLYLQVRFLGLPAALCGLCLVAWWRGPQPGPRRKHSSDAARALVRALERIDTAARAGDGAAVFVAARDAVRDQFAVRWNIAPDRVTEAEVAARLGAAGTTILDLFKIVDEMRYSGRNPAAMNLGQWNDIVRALLLRGGPP